MHTTSDRYKGMEGAGGIAGVDSIAGSVANSVGTCDKKMKSMKGAGARVVMCSAERADTESGALPLFPCVWLETVAEDEKNLR
jgi:hypothetical protein